eukprot:TRINITY_DN21001_c0_g1_i5.p1 TRINITY_DN21001_c0_g1~~TRINITY_DN21001_c0_g1_i5.p1  ORF type:complete len:173 (+),score=21.19 TRINITY_DN21001_c0_g1_i5:30-521(+)
MKFVSVFICLIATVTAVKWKDSRNPNELITLDKKNFCMFTEGDKEYIGTVSQGQSGCQGLLRTGSKVKISDSFKSLTKDGNEKIGWKYCTGHKKPTRAIPCDDSKALGAGDCFLGESVYGDGICHEELGFIQGRFVYMIHNGKKSRCPFRLYLVETSQDSQCV